VSEDEDLLEAPRSKIRPWLVVVLGAALLVIGLIQLARRDTHHATAAKPTPTTATSQPRVIDGQALLSSVVGNRCPTGVICGVGDTVAPGMRAALRTSFPSATVNFQARAFDAGRPRTYWQQISATTPDGTSIVLTEQRAIKRPHHPPGLNVQVWPTASAVTVHKWRGDWEVTAELLGTDTSGKLPVAVAKHWVAVVPLPR
jgi:hypothetical protein